MYFEVPIVQPPEPSNGRYPDEINNGLIGLFRPEVLFQNEPCKERPWRWAPGEPVPKIIADPTGQHGIVWSFDANQDGWAEALDSPQALPGGSKYQPDQLTVALWARHRDNQQPRAACCMHSTDFNQTGWGMYLSEEGTADWVFKSWVERWDDGAATSVRRAVFDQWYHWAFTHDGVSTGANTAQGDLTQYIDGEQDGFLPNLERLKPSGGATAVVAIGNARLTESRPWRGEVAEVRIYNRVLKPAEIRALYEAPTRYRTYFPRSIYLPPTEGPPSFTLVIDPLDHARSLDQVNLLRVAQDLPVEDLIHVRPVDGPIVVPSYDIFAATLTHVRPVDELLLEVTTDLIVEDLVHEVPLDDVDVLSTTATLLSIDELDHARFLDIILLEPTHNLVVEGLDHARFLEETDVQVLLGDATELRATAADWRMDAGQTLITTAGADQNWHVIDCVFDGVNSEIRVDNGPAVIGDAGVRALELLSLGADVDGENRAIGYVAEFRIYNNNIPLNFRQSIADFLIKKWIQP